MNLVWIIICLAFRVALGSNGKGGIVEPRDFETNWYFVISIHMTTGIGTTDTAKNSTFLCTGTILTHKVAMTTKSCIEPYKMYQLMINSNNYEVNLDGKWYQKRHTVDARFFHPKYDFALLGVFPEFMRQLVPSMFLPLSDPSDVAVDSKCRTAGFSQPNHKVNQQCKQLLYQTLKIKSPAKSGRPELLWGQVCHGDTSPLSLLILTKRQLGLGFPGGPLICTINGNEVLVGMSLVKKEKKCLTEFLNLSYLSKEIRKFLKANPARTRPPRNGQASLTEVSYQTFVLFAMFKISI